MRPGCDTTGADIRGLTRFATLTAPTVRGEAFGVVQTLVESAMKLRARIRRGPIVAMLAVAIVVVACGGATQPSPQAATPTPAPTTDPTSAATVEALRARPYGERNTDAAIEALGRSGIAVVETVEATTPVRPVEGPSAPLRFARWQVHAIGLEAATEIGRASCRERVLTDV